MKIAHLTAGSGNFHCGTCLRDHALVRALAERNHDCMMAPLYLPFVLDKPDKHSDDDQTIHLGGVNVYLQQVFSPMRRTPRWIDRVFDSPMLLRFAAKRAGMTSASQLGVMTHSLLRGENGPQRKEVKRLANYLTQDARPDVIMLSNALLIGVARALRNATGAKIICSLQGEDTFLDALPQPWRDQCWAELTQRAADVDAFIAVSAYHQNLMCNRLSIDASRCHVVHNGIDLTGYEPATTPPAAPTIGYLARLCPPKGLHTLVDAFIHIRQRIPNAKLRIAGAATAADEAYIAEQNRKLFNAGLTDAVTIETNITLEEKQAFLRKLSVLSVPATYGESFGLYIIEALACGIPVVQPDHAAFGELMTATGGGRLCLPDDPIALADAITSLLQDEPARSELGKRGRAAVQERFTMQTMGAGVEAVLHAVHPRATESETQHGV